MRVESIWIWNAPRMHSGSKMPITFFGSAARNGIHVMAERRRWHEMMHGHRHSDRYCFSIWRIRESIVVYSRFFAWVITRSDGSCRFCSIKTMLNSILRAKVQMQISADLRWWPFVKWEEDRRILRAVIWFLDAQRA